MISIRNITPKEIEEYKQETIDRFSPYTEAELPISVRYISGNAYIQKEDIEGGAFYAGCSEGCDEIGQTRFHDSMEEAIASISSKKTIYDNEFRFYCEPFAGIVCVEANGLITGYPLYVAVGDRPFDQNAYIAAYNKENYARIELKIPKDKKTEWQAKAKAAGMSLTEYITKKVEGETDMYPYEPTPTPEVIHEETIHGAEYKIIKSYEMVPYGEVQDYTTGKVKKYGGPTPFYKILRNGEIFAKFHSEEDSMKHLDKIR